MEIPHKIRAIIFNIAQREYHKHPSLHCMIELNDLVNEGFIGYLKAKKKHKADIADIENYAYKRILGSIIDYIRKHYPFSHRGYDKKKDKYEFVPIESVCNEYDKSISYEQDVMNIDLIRKLGHILNRREKTILLYYYWKDMTMKAIGKELNLSEASVSLAHRLALKKLRWNLKRH